MSPLTIAILGGSAIAAPALSYGAYAWAWSRRPAVTSRALRKLKRVFTDASIGELAAGLRSASESDALRPPLFWRWPFWKRGEEE